MMSCGHILLGGRHSWRYLCVWREYYQLARQVPRASDFIKNSSTLAKVIMTLSLHEIRIHSNGGSRDLIHYFVTVHPAGWALWKVVLYLVVKLGVWILLGNSKRCVLHRRHSFNKAINHFSELGNCDYSTPPFAQVYNQGDKLRTPLSFLDALHRSEANHTLIALRMMSKAMNVMLKITH